MILFGVFLLTVVWRCRGQNSSLDQDLDDMEEERRKILGRESVQIIRYNALCVLTDWSCNRVCRRQFAHPTDKCVRPRGDYCFDQLIAYNFTEESREPFPHQLSVLSLFPRCWDNLMPLVCGHHYRPCTNRKYIEAGQKQISRMEFWQVFPYSLCHRAMRSCEFLQHFGVSLDVLQCDNTDRRNDERQLFDKLGQCKMRFSGVPTVPSTSCLSPLMRVHPDFNPKFANALVDECYMPCTSSFASDSRLSVFRTIMFMTALLLSALFLIMIFVVFRRSINPLPKFALLNVFTLAFLWHGLWVLTLINHNSIENSATCERAGFNFVRKEVKKGELDWCLAQSALLHFFFVSSSTWLSIYIAMFTLPQPSACDAKSQVSSATVHGLNVQSLLALTVTAWSASCALVGLWFRPTVMDGLTGVCHLALGPISESWAYYLPTFVIMMTLVVYCVKNMCDGGVNYGGLLKDAVLFVAFFACPVLSFGIHLTFKYNGSFEKEQLIRMIRCVINVVKQHKNDLINVSEETSHCVVGTATSYALFSLFLHVLLVPSLPYILVATGIVIKTRKKTIDLDEVKAQVVEDRPLLPLMPEFRSRQPSSVGSARSRIARPHRLRRSSLASSIRSRRKSLSVPSQSWRSSHLGPLGPSTSNSLYNSMHNSVYNSLYRSETLLNRNIFSTPSSVFSVPVDDISLHSYQLPPSRAKDFLDLTESNQPVNSAANPGFPSGAVVNGQSPVLAFLGDFIREAKFVEMKMLCLQIALDKFRDLFERDPLFATYCNSYRAANFAHPEVNTLCGDHVVSVHQVIAITSVIRDEHGLLRMARLCGMALKSALEEVAHSRRI